MHVMQFCVVGETVITDISDQLHVGMAFIRKKNPSCMLHSCIYATIVKIYICISDSTCITIRCMLYVLTQMLCSS